MTSGAASTPQLTMRAAVPRPSTRLRPDVTARHSPTPPEGDPELPAQPATAHPVTGGLPMQMQQIRYFLALARVLNFTRAAEACNVSQPAFTRAIQTLEAELGGELIRRERGNSHLTPLGHRMLPLMQQCYDAAVSAHALAKAVQSNAVAPLCIGLSCSINIDTFLQPIGEVFRAYPGLQFKIRRGTGAVISSMLKRGEIEFAIAGPLDTSWERMDHWPIFTEPMAVTLHRDHHLAQLHTLEIQHLAGERLLCLVGAEMANTQIGYLAKNGVRGVITHEVECDHDLLALLHANAGIAIMPASAPHSPTLRRLPVRGWELERTVSAYAAFGRQRTPVATTLLNLIRAADWSGSKSDRPAIVNNLPRRLPRVDTNPARYAAQPW